MEGEINESLILDYAVFHTSPAENSYKAYASHKGIVQAMASGPLDQLELHLAEAKGCQMNCIGTSFKLQLVDAENGFSWFTIGTLSRFLQIVNSPEALEVAKAIEGEMTQLQETRKFHISLYAKDQDQSTGGTTDIGCTTKIGLGQQIKVETASSDATKNELLRALDVRLMALEEELATSFDRAVGSTCSHQQIADLLAFAEHFGTMDIRNLFLKLLSRRPRNQPNDPSSVQPASSSHVITDSNATKNVFHPAPQNAVKSVKNLVSPAKIAQAERQDSSDSEESSNSSIEEQSHTERSRTLVRSATPRRSASPMRRIQIGRSGSRRSTSLAIKSLNYFPAREKNATIMNADGTDSGDEEPYQPQKRPENSVRRLSVQDAISLFERKQNDQNSDAQKKRPSGDSLASTTAKSVLRRWSAGMGDSFTRCSHDNVAGAATEDTEEQKPEEVKVESSKTDETSEVVTSSAVVNTILPPTESHAEPVAVNVEEVNERAIASAEWSRQKEVELNQMLMKMMESKSGKHRGSKAGTGLQQVAPSEQRGGLYSHYREKRDEKLRAEQGGKRVVKEAQYKVIKESLEQSKAEMASKSVSAKRESPNHSQRSRRNSSPPVLPKKEVSKPAGSRKASPKTSPLPATRNSWSAGSLPRTSATTPTTKTPGKLSTNGTTNRQTPLSKSSVAQPSPKTERLHQAKGKKGIQPDGKASLKAQEEKKQRPVTKSSKTAKTKSPATPGDDSGVLLAKPSFYNKVTKKSSVVPLESKPFLKKGTGTGSKGSAMVTKPKISALDDSSKNSGNLVLPEENESSAVIAETTPEVLEVEVVQPANDDADSEVPKDIDVSQNPLEDCDQNRNELDNTFNNAVEISVPDIQADEDMGISSAAWVEVEREECSASCDNDLSDLAVSPEITPAVELSSPRVRHSLSQMLQADNNEPEIIEWGNAENPPALVFQKDAPKGFKRLLKFARKSKGEANASGWASPSVFSEGEDDTEDPKGITKRGSDALLRKAALQAKGYDPPKSMSNGIFESGNASKRSMDYRGMESVPALSNASTATILDRLREGQNSASASSTKATRSFFSLSTFRSNK